MILSPVTGMQREANRRRTCGRGEAHEPEPHRAWAVKDTTSCEEVASTPHVHDLHRIRGTAKRADQWEVIRLIVPVISGVVVAAGVLLAAPQPQSSQSGSYHHLSDRGRELADGIAQDADDYNRLTVSQRATFEAVVHALEREGIDGLIVSVTAVWGADGSRDGTRQFRISVVLVKDVERILSGNGYDVKRRGHVILPTGEENGDSDADSARQPGRPPKLQISWLEADPTIGEVDVDYRPFHRIIDSINFVFPFIPVPGRHLDPDNSNVMARLPGGRSHYSLHLERYGPGLFPWWD